MEGDETNYREEEKKEQKTQKRPEKASFGGKKKDQVEHACANEHQKSRVAEGVDQAGQQIEKLLEVGESELVEDVVCLHLAYCQGCYTC